MLARKWVNWNRTKEKYSDMLNMKALVGIRIIFMGKDFEW